jgi:hypothetical protein
VTYSYALGLYLGDGYIAEPGGNPFLRVFLDAAYVRIVEEARDALRELWPAARVTQHSPAGVRLTILQLSDPDLPHAFPQHGPGKKHTRPIVLERWQAELTAAHPEALLRGLIHSDGCRTINRFEVKLPSGRIGQYEYPRYFFSNLSTDIRRIFTDHCELLGIRWTQSNPRNISISQRASVALLEKIVGPKR